MSTSESWGVNRHTAWYTSPISMVSQCKLVSGWGLRKWRSATPYGPCGSGRTLPLYYFYTKMLHTNFTITAYTTQLCCATADTVCKSYIMYIQCAAKMYPLKMFAIFYATSCNFYVKFYMLNNHSSRKNAKRQLIAFNYCKVTEIGRRKKKKNKEDLNYSGKTGRGPA